MLANQIGRCSQAGVLMLLVDAMRISSTVQRCFDRKSYVQWNRSVEETFAAAEHDLISEVASDELNCRIKETTFLTNVARRQVSV